jgi:hypothetical protein
VERAERPTTSLTLERFAARSVLLIAAALFVLEMALASKASTTAAGTTVMSCQQIRSNAPTG